MDNQQEPVESRDSHRTIIILNDGSTFQLGGADERVTLDADGGHVMEKTDVRVATRDGHIIDVARGDVAFRCPICNTGPWSRYVMGGCVECRHLVCSACLHRTTSGALCEPCHKRQRRRERIAWFLSIF